jgi:hypothetical protein
MARGMSAVRDDQDKRHKDVRTQHVAPRLGTSENGVTFTASTPMPDRRMMTLSRQSAWRQLRPHRADDLLKGDAVGSHALLDGGRVPRAAPAGGLRTSGPASAPCTPCRPDLFSGQRQRDSWSVNPLSAGSEYQATQPCAAPHAAP